jgi:hypothetical protein
MAVYQDIYIDEATDVKVEFCLDRIPSLNLDDYTFTGELKKCYSSTESILFTFSLNNDLNKIYGHLSAVDTETLESGRYVYDIVATNNTDNKIYKAFYGTAFVTPNVTA